MTWKTLEKHIQEMSKEQRETDVTFWDSNQDEYIALTALDFSDPTFCDVLDANHPFLVRRPC